jgi:hypothetical protein
MEFPPWGARGSFTVGHKELHLHVAVAQKWGPTEMILTAYDRNGRVIAKSHMTITPASGFDNELQVQSPSADIIAFTLEAPYGVNTGPPLLYDLVFDDPPVMDLGGVDAMTMPMPPTRTQTSTSPSASSATASSTASASASASSTERGAWLERVLLALGLLLLIAFGYFLWRSR